MANAKEFFAKNKKAIYVGGGLLVAGTASYFIFFNKDKDGKTLFGKWTKKPKVEDKPEPKPPVTNVVSNPNRPVGGGASGTLLHTE